MKVNSLHAKSLHNERLHSGKRSSNEPVYIPNQHLDIVHRQMLQEAMERNALRPRRSPKQKQEKRQRRLLRVPALLMVKLGRRLEGFGQAYLEDRQRCSA